MKKNKIIGIIVFCLIIIGSFFYAFSRRTIEQQDIAEKLIRFHVLANSDTTEDQGLKLKVRDEVLKYMCPILKESKSIEESREIIKENDSKIKEIAEKVIKERGYSYDVTTKLSYENFPVKSYANITLPQGKYEAYRIIIGSGEGHNWWCVMFPPLCFTDITKGEVAYEETKKDMEKILTPEEYEFVDSSKENNNCVMKLKVVEVIKSAYEKNQVK